MATFSLAYHLTPCLSAHGDSIQCEVIAADRAYKTCGIWWLYIIYIFLGPSSGQLGCPQIGGCSSLHFLNLLNHSATRVTHPPQSRLLVSSDSKSCITWNCPWLLIFWAQIMSIPSARGRSRVSFSDHRRFMRMAPRAFWGLNQVN